MKRLLGRGRDHGRSVTWLIGAALVAGLLAACGAEETASTSSRGGTAAAAVVRQLGYVDREEFGRQWDELHPAQQAFVPRGLFVRCAEAALGGLAIGTVKVLETTTETVEIEGTDQRVEASAVSVEFPLTQSGTQVTLKNTYREALVDGNWRWLMVGVEPYKQGMCP